MQKGKKHSVKAAPYAGMIASATEALESRCLLSASSVGFAIPNVTLQPAGSSATVLGYTPAQIRSAYGFNSVSGNGAGQTIAIVDAYNDPNIASDLATFDSHFGLTAPPSLKVVSQTGGNVSSIPTDAGWAGEISLDVEWAHAIAPGANILLVEAGSASLGNLMSAVNYARNATGVSVVSMSWGGSEFYGQTHYDGYFTTPASHTGVTFVAASGDDGSRFGVEWPASSPNVLSVGGTTLNLSGSTGNYSSETPWSDSTGGYSDEEREPEFQRGVQNSGARTVPDVSYDANPLTGYAVYDSISYGGSSGWAVYGGTSAGAPQWGALIAVCDQTRVADKLGTLDGATQTLPTLYQPASGATTYAADYHDVTAQASSWFSRTTFQIDVGYDLQTGLGTPKYSAVSQGLIAAPPHLTTTATTTTTTDTTGAAPALARPTGQGAADVHAQQGLPPAPAQSASPSAGNASGAVARPSSSAVVFSDTLIHHDAGSSVPQSAGVALNEISPAPPVAALPSATTASWLGRTDASLVSWLTGGDDSAGAPATAIPAMAARAAGSIANAVNSVPALAHTANAMAATLAAPSAGLPAAILYRFANFDPVATFSDAISDFARESSSPSPVLATLPQHGTHRAWLITGAVIGIDALLVGRWYVDRRAAKRRAGQQQNSETDPESPQAGLLPTGL